MPNLKIQLTDSIEVRGAEVSVLSLRTPTLDDVNTIGFPFTINNDGSFQPIAPLIMEYVIRLGKIPRSSARKISVADFAGECMPEVLSLFGQDAQNQEDSKNG